MQAWRYAAQVSGDVVRAARVVGGSTSVDEVKEMMLRSVEGVGRTPAFHPLRWQGHVRDVPRGERGEAWYAWGLMTPRVLGVRVNRLLMKVCYDQTREVTEKTRGEVGYSMAAVRFVTSAARALRLVGHVAWLIDAWAQERSVTLEATVGEVREMVKCLEPVAHAPAAQAGRLLRVEAERREVDWEVLVVGERVFEQVWRRYAPAAVMYEWGVAMAGPDHPLRCGRYLPAGARLRARPR